MKKITIIVLFLLGHSFILYAQNKTVLKVEVKQQKQLTLEALGNPKYEGDISKLKILGGTAPYTYNWERANDSSTNSYCVTVQDENDCTAVIYINVEGYNDMEEIGLETGIYPNPTTDIVNISLPQTENEVTVRLINSEGVLLYRKTINTIHQIWQLSLNTCLPGKYYIQITGSTTKTYPVIKK